MKTLLFIAITLAGAAILPAQSFYVYPARTECRDRNEPAYYYPTRMDIIREERRLDIERSIDRNAANMRAARAESLALQASFNESRDAKRQLEATEAQTRAIESQTRAIKHLEK